MLQVSRLGVRRRTLRTTENWIVGRRKESGVEVNFTRIPLWNDLSPSDCVKTENELALFFNCGEGEAYVHLEDIRQDVFDLCNICFVFNIHTLRQER